MRFPILISASAASILTVLAIPTEFQPVNPSVLFDQAIRSSCSTLVCMVSQINASKLLTGTSSMAQAVVNRSRAGTTQSFNLAGYCPNDLTGVQCCVTKICSTSSGSGVCMNTGDTCSGRFVAGACPGPSSIQVGASLQSMLIILLALYRREMLHFVGKRCLSIAVELVQWLVCCWCISGSQQPSGK